MSEVKKVTKNSIFVFSARVIEAILNLVVFAIIARYLGVKGFGLYSFVIAIIWVLSPMLFLGLNQILARDVAVNKEKAPHSIGNGLVLNLLMTMPVLVFAMIIAAVFDMDRTPTISLCIAVGTFLFKAFARNYFAVIIAYEKMKFLMVVSIITRVTEVLFMIFVAMLDLGFINLFIASFIAELLGVIACIVIFRKKFLISRPKVVTGEIVPLLKECMPITTSLFLMEAFLYVNVFILIIFATDIDVGLFQGPHKILTRLQMFPMALFVAFLPMFSRAAASEETAHKFDELFARTFKWILIVSLPLSMVGVLFSNEIILLLFGKEFFQAGTALQILLMAFPFLCLNVLCRYLFLILKMYRFRVISDSLLVLANIVISILLVPSYGFIGASLGTLGAILIQIVINILFLSGHFREAKLHKTFFVPLISGFIIFSLIFGFRDLNNIVLFPAGIIIYILLLVIFKTFSEEDVLYIKKLVGMKKSG